MRKFKIFSAAMLMFAAAVSSCTDYQDDIEMLEVRVSQIEQVVKTANDQLASMQTLLQAMQDGDYITSVAPVADGYTINFKKFGNVTIKDGKDGVDAVAPVLNLMEADPDGDGVKNLYWSVDGQLLKVDNAPVRADGIDALQPVLDINAEGKWIVHYGDPANATILGPAVGPKGDKGDNAVAEPLLFNKVEVFTGFVRFTLNEKVEGTEDLKTFEVPLTAEGYGKLFLPNTPSGYYGAMYPGQTVKVTPEDFGKPADSYIETRGEVPAQFLVRSVEDGHALLITFKGADYSAADKDNLNRIRLHIQCGGRDAEIRPCGYAVYYNGILPNNVMQNTYFASKAALTTMMTLRGDLGPRKEEEEYMQTLPAGLAPQVKIVPEVRFAKTPDGIIGLVDETRTAQAQGCVTVHQNVFVTLDTAAVRALKIRADEYFILNISAGDQYVGNVRLANNKLVDYQGI